MNPFALPVDDLAHVLSFAQADLEALRGKHILISGGTGFFGKWILGVLMYADAELELGFKVTVLSRDPDSFLRRHPAAGRVPAIRWVKGEVAEYSEATQGFEFILHAAADTTAVASEAREAERTRTIVEGTGRMLDLAQRSGAQRMLNISSGAVYGAYAGQLSGAREDDYAESQPMTAYARAKREAEQLCESSGVDFVTARAFAFLGPHLPLEAHFAAGNFLRDAVRGGPIVVRGDGTALRSYLHPADLVVWLLRLLIRGRRARAYNVGSDEVVTTAQLARRIADAVSPRPKVVIQSVQPQGPQNIYLPDIKRAGQELDLTVAIRLNDAIARTVAYLRSRADQPCP